MAATATRLLTAEEFERLPDPGDGSRQELVRGMVLSIPLVTWPGKADATLDGGDVLPGFAYPVADFFE